MIKGKLQMAFVPYDQENTGAKYKSELGEALNHLYVDSDKGFTYGFKELPSHNHSSLQCYCIEVEDNTNFWFQLTQLPKLLISHFWELPKEEVKKMCDTYVENDAWELENTKKLAMKIHGFIVVNEEYDSTAEGTYNYVIRSKADFCSVDVNYCSNKKIHHANALRKQIESIKYFLDNYAKGQNVKIQKTNYFGMWK